MEGIITFRVKVALMMEFRSLPSFMLKILSCNYSFSYASAVFRASQWCHPFEVLHGQ
jgi:hypothetical protein